VKKFIAKLFRLEPQFVVEFRRPPRVLDPNDDEYIASLKGHPGFEAVMAKLDAQRAYLESRLSLGDHEDLRSVIRLQEGIRWLGYLETQVNYATKKKNTRLPVEASFDLAEEFNKINASIQRVGTPQESNEVPQG
jgi:hypothetical protein